MKQIKIIRHLLLAALLLFAIDIYAQSAGPWKIKETAAGEFLIRDHGNGYNAFTIEPQTMNDAIYIGSNGVVGFGTTTPDVLYGNKLDVKGDISLEDGNAWLEVNNTWTNSNAGINFLENGVYKGWFFYHGGYDFLRFSCDAGGWANHLVIHPTGAVCVGTSTVATGYQLSVAGKVACEEVLVKAVANWPDDVFNEGYYLMNLKQLEKSIQENHHLPGIPSAKEVKENGFQLADMQRRVLGKVEELTLYTIDQGKMIEEQGKLIKELQKKIEALEKENKN